MAKVIMTCGKICAGKSCYAQSLREKYKAVILSVDEITLALFGQDAGDKLDDYVAAAEKYLFNKSVEIVETGINVILDWGFWTRREREEAREFYRSHEISCELHYINIAPDEWERRIEHRNADVSAGRVSAYLLDSGLREKLEAIFEPPTDEEFDVIITQ